MVHFCVLDVLLVDATTHKPSEELKAKVAWERDNSMHNRFVSTKGMECATLR